MLGNRTKADGSLEYIDQIHDLGNVDYVDQNGGIVAGAPIKCVLVRSATDLQLLTNYETGTIAFLPAFEKVWQKNASGIFVEI